MINMGDRLVEHVFSYRSPIPEGILKAAFKNKRELESDTISMVIYREIYVNGFLRDIQTLVGGTEVKIDVSGLTIMPIGNTAYSEMRIPKSLTMGREITEAYELYFSLPPLLNTAGYSGSTILNPVITQASTNPLSLAASNLLSSMDTVPITGTSKLRVVGDNVIRIGEILPYGANMMLRCSVAFTEKLNEINEKAFETLSEAFTLLVQAAIYKTMIIELDEGQLRYGQQLGVIKEIVSEYKDSSKEYRELINTKVRSTLMWNDPERKLAMVQNAVGWGPR